MQLSRSDGGGGGTGAEMKQVCGKITKFAALNDKPRKCISSYFPQ
jgi:hypothetical protein